MESKPVVQKLKKKTELEDSLLKAIEEHGEDVQQATSNQQQAESNASTTSEDSPKSPISDE